MMFIKEQESFFKTYNVDLLIEMLNTLDITHVAPGEYCAFGAEFVFNGLGIKNGATWYSIRNLIEDRYENGIKHSFELIHNWDSFLFFSPSDIRGLIFDFSYIRDNKIICYNGITREFTHDIVNELTINEFLNVYGFQKFYSCSHYKVKWNNCVYEWNN